jgi:hypothetical protein
MELISSTFWKDQGGMQYDIEEKSVRTFFDERQDEAVDANASERFSMTRGCVAQKKVPD